MSKRVLGRDEELRTVDTFLDDAATRPAALVISGDPGIGKTLIWEVAVDLAVARGFGVLACRPAASETSLSFAGLFDLAANVEESLLDSLPVPQRRALEIALMRTDPRGPGPSRLAISIAFLTIATSLAAERQLLIAVDDAQWLDVETTTVLGYLAHRVGDRRIGFLVAVRSSIDGGPLELGRSYADGLRSIELGALNFSDLFRLLRDQIGESFSRPILRKIEDASGGNPFFALELGRALARRGHESALEDGLLVPLSLQQLVEERLSRLSNKSLRVLAYAAVAVEPSVDLIARAMVQPQEEIVGALSPARALGVAEIRSGIVMFDHPLLAAAAWTREEDATQQAIYRSLADAADDPELRARYLAAAEPSPDEDVARALEDGALRAGHRGGHDAAAELWRLAVDLTPAHLVDDMRRRLLELAGARFIAGDTDGAANLLEKLAESAQQGPDRARVLLRLAKVRHEQRNAQEALACCERAAAESGDDGELLAEIWIQAAYVEDDDMERRAEYARTALAISETGVADASISAQALIVFTLAELCLGKGLRRDLIDRAVELEGPSPPEMVSVRAATNLGEFLMRCDDLAGARPLVERSLEVARASDESSRCEALACAAQLEFLTGQWGRAETLLSECLDAAEWSGQPIKTVEGLRLLAPLHAARGQFEAADLEMSSLRGLVAELDDSNARLMANIAEGTVALHRGDMEVASERLAKADAEDERQHMREPGFRRYMGDLVEALIATGHVDEALEVLTRLEHMAVSLDRPSALAASARSYALLAADVGDLKGALAACDQARRQCVRLNAPFELARTLLVEATLRRRMRQKAVAGGLFDEAATIFDRLGASPWSKRARAERERIGGGSGSGSDLTATERRVAELVAGGMKNRDVAAALFMSPRSVEANLTKVYRKLGVSRAAIGSALNEPRKS